MSQIPLIVFEDPGFRRFGPLTSLRPVWDLIIGMETLGNRIARMLDTQPYSWIPRDSLRDLIKEKYGSRATNLPTKGDVFLVNGRIVGEIPTQGLQEESPYILYTEGPDIVAARMPAAVARHWLKTPKRNPVDFSAHMLLSVWTQIAGTPEVEVREVKNSLAWWPWDLLKKQGDVIKRALARVGDGQINGELHHSAILVEETNIHIATGASVQAGAILDASEGPIVVMEGATIMPGAIVIGPVVVGERSVIKAGAKLYGPLSIGPMCKLGGEIASSIFIGHSNKQHDGFIGNSIVGEWVNLGADTNNSDLKNNYSDVSVTLHGEQISTGTSHFGSIIGDHVKTAINTQMNTGAVIGVGSNLFGAGFPPKTIGAFRWGGDDNYEMYDLERFLITAKTVMQRRDRELTPAMLVMLRNLHAAAIGGAE
jgi:UDP-N-acetylglucosamine diphosphorylase / glucose-1-phosphate thymidylyltransferase / UDP-N-acetylgalactosamine diphosphorylase / glucosamine-1-phosphate N-acetyltransferase / galactosamine-1-phosphate N-acetyltransferase